MSSGVNEKEKNREEEYKRSFTVGSSIDFTPLEHVTP